MASTSTHVVSSGNLADLVSPTEHPDDDAVLAVLNTRFRSDLPYSRIGTTHLVAINPCKILSNADDAAAREYAERCYRDTSLSLQSANVLQPHIYQLATQMCLLMRRRKESQSLVMRGMTCSGKTHNARLLKEHKVASQIKALHTLLDAFGNSKTPLNPNASRHGRYLELHFSDRGRIESAKVLAFALDKSRLTRLTHEERTYHIFYQFLAGAAPQERDHFALEDPSDYALLASSGCYRLPSGPFSDDAIAMEDIRVAMRNLGFKPKSLSSIFSILSIILLLSNIQFVEADARDVSASVANIPVLEQVARLLGVPPEDLAQVLTNKSNYVRKELYTVLLNVEQSMAQRDQFMRDLYAILFAYIVETANHRICPGGREIPPATQIVVLDQPGYQTRGSAATGSMMLTGNAPLVSAFGQNGFDEFSINFTNELDAVGYNGCITSDGVSLPSVVTVDNSACVELLRGAPISEWAARKPGGLLGIMNKACSAYKSGKAGDKKAEDMLQDFVAKFGVHTFGINHYCGSCSYDVTHFVEKDADLLDAALVTLLRSSSDSFVTKLVSGPSLATEQHSKDESIAVQAQVSSRPPRQPTPITSLDGSVSPSTGDDQPQLDPTKIYSASTQLNFTLSELFAPLDRARLWTVSCIRPNDSGSPNSFDKRRVKAQIRSLLIPDIVARRSIEYVVDYMQNEFCERYCAAAHGWQEDSDYVLGHRSIWLAYDAWKTVEDGLRAMEKEQRKQGIDGGAGEDDESIVGEDGTEYTHADAVLDNESRDNLLIARVGTHGSQYQDPNQAMSYGGSGLHSPNVAAPAYTDEGDQWGSEWGKKSASARASVPASKESTGRMVVNPAPAAVEEVPTSRSRRWWLFIHGERSWTIFMLIFLLNGSSLGGCCVPDYDKVWDSSEVAEHTGDTDWWVSIQGWVYDMSNFIHGDHSDISGLASNAESNLDMLVGQDLTDYFPPPLALACNGLVTEASLELTYKNFTPTVPTAMHNSGATQSATGTALDNSDWYSATFLPKIKQYRKGALVWDPSEIASQASDQNIQRIWAIWEGGIYDLTDYVNTVSINQGATSQYEFLNTDITDVFKQQAGQDITSSLNKVLATLDSSTVTANMNCIQSAFYLGQTDFRKTARCQVQNYMLLVFTSIICGSIVLKFLCALQLGPKRHPELQDKFVLCQIPCYTEGEDSLRRTIDSLASMNYDDKRKLLFIICDGNIIGSGNDRTTPRIVLDILGIDPKVDPEPLMFRSIGEGSKQLNYGKVYSGLYEFEGHVVPYMVVVKVGKPTERSKPGNRGKRDSQILLMHYLNRVHFDAPMSPLELEIYHQMRNVIGIDPAFYEYLFTVDADTQVTPDSLNRLVASAADDSSIIGICGETKLTNEEGSWWTMIQVYEYYISHHLSKAFESLFGSVSCLPGCFSLYRIRTADKGRPIIISNRVIDEYAEGHIDTLHKKNLFSLGEDRFLTTLLLKHFPTFKTKFIPDAVAHTMAPESWRVLFSQRRRWINSTIHNLLELVVLPELCGFCCFSMRFFVFIDLLGTLILPATVVYLFYLIIVVATGQAAVPIISIIMLAVTYARIHARWLVGGLFTFVRAFHVRSPEVLTSARYPVYGFFLPLYSFWCMDDFSWGNTRVVIGEGGNKKVLMNEEERFDESVIPLKKFGEYEAEAWERGSHRSDDTGYTKPRSQKRFVQSRPSSPQSFHQSIAGDYYRDTNAMNNSTSNIRGPASHQSHGSRQGSMYDGRQRTISQFAAPQLPFIPFGGGPGSVTGSDHGGLMQPQLLPFGYQHTGSVYGMMPADPRTTMMPNVNMLTGSGSQPGSFGLLPPTLGDARPMSTFSMATSVNAFSGPSLNPNPTDDELYNALRTYLSTQDLMTVTKKTAREAIMAKFPKADLASRKEFLNQSIDNILSGPPTK
ncbi:glycosyltransferase family 2 protein [Pisolithus marmoratus]|nr:glycosyltransferase family 2 protein [Pisolithus marmoratus]